MANKYFYPTEGENIYIVTREETLEDIAKKTGVSYDKLLELNPDYEGKLLKKDYRVRLKEKEVPNTEVTETKETITDKQKGSLSETAQTKEEREAVKLAQSIAKETLNAAKEAAQAVQKAAKEAEAKQKKQLRKEGYQEEIRQAEEDYQTGVASANTQLNDEQKNLANRLYQNRIRLKSDLAAQKMDASSIAEREHKNLTEQYRQNQETLDRDYGEKIEKLKTALQRKKTSGERKIAEL